jgi:hypothetical protein
MKNIIISCLANIPLRPLQRGIYVLRTQTGLGFEPAKSPFEGGLRGMSKLDNDPFYFQNFHQAHP